MCVQKELRGLRQLENTFRAPHFPQSLQFLRDYLEFTFQSPDSATQSVQGRPYVAILGHEFISFPARLEFPNLILELVSSLRVLGQPCPVVCHEASAVFSCLCPNFSFPWGWSRGLVATLVTLETTTFQILLPSAP